MKESKIYYVYCLINPLDGKIFYIGYGKNFRLSEHWECFLKYGPEQEVNKYKRDVLIALQKKGLAPIEKVLTANLVTKIIAKKIERGMIRNYGRIVDGGILTNLAHGGNEGAMDLPECVAKMVKSRKKFFKTPEGKQLAKRLAEENSLKFKDRVPVNDGVVEFYIKKDESIPEGFTVGRLEYVGVLISEKLTGRRWITNGIEEKLQFVNDANPLPIGWRIGRSKSSYEKISKAVEGRIIVNNGEKFRFIRKTDPIPEGFYNKGFQNLKKNNGKSKNNKNKRN